MPELVVTGLSGLVGTRFQELYGKAYKLRNLDLTAGVDITDTKAVDAAVKESRADVILHLAAYTNVSKAHEQYGDKDGPCYQVNVVGSEAVVEAAKKQGKYLIHVSTDYVFNGEKEMAYTEEDEPDPIEWYGQTKFWAEEVVEENLDDYVILRLAYPYQSGPMRPDFLAKMIEKLKDDSLPPAFTDHTITPTFVDDLAGVFDYCVRNRPQGLYHAVGSSWHTDHEMAMMVKDVFELPGTVREGSLEEYLKTVERPYQKTMKVSNEKLRREFGLTMNSLRTGLNIIREQEKA